MTVPVMFSFGTPYPQGASRLSTANYVAPVNATQGGAAYNLAAAPVQFAFMPQATQVPQAADWVTGAWYASLVSILYPWNAACLIGPAGTITLGPGSYVVYMKIIAAGQAPVKIIGQFQVS